MLNIICVFAYGDQGNVECGPMPYRDLVFAGDNVGDFKKFAKQAMDNEQPDEVTRVLVDNAWGPHVVVVPFGYTVELQEWTEEAYKGFKEEEAWANSLCPPECRQARKFFYTAIDEQRKYFSMRGGLLQI